MTHLSMCMYSSRVRDRVSITGSATRMTCDSLICVWHDSSWFVTASITHLSMCMYSSRVRDRVSNARITCDSLICVWHESSWFVTDPVTHWFVYCMTMRDIHLTHFDINLTHFTLGSNARMTRDSFICVWHESSWCSFGSFTCRWQKSSWCSFDSFYFGQQYSDDKWLIHMCMTCEFVIPNWLTNSHVPNWLILPWADHWELPRTRHPSIADPVMNPHESNSIPRTLMSYTYQRVTRHQSIADRSRTLGESALYHQLSRHTYSTAYLVMTIACVCKKSPINPQKRPIYPQKSPVNVFTCTCVCITRHERRHVCVCLWRFVYVVVRVYVYLRTYIHMHMCMCHSSRTQAYVRVPANVCICSSTCICVHMHVYCMNSGCRLWRALFWIYILFLADTYRALLRIYRALLLTRRASLRICRVQGSRQICSV